MRRKEFDKFVFYSTHQLLDGFWKNILMERKMKTNHKGELKMKPQLNSITINGVEYVEKSKVENIPAIKVDDMEYVVIRTYSAGVFAGYLESRDGKEAVLRQVRRIWYWDGANSLSQLAVDGVSKPENCKFAVVVDKLIVTEVIEVISVTEKARKNIEAVKVWK